MSKKTDPRHSLRLILIGPFVILVLSLAITIGVLSYRTGSKAVSSLSDNLLREMVERIGQAVDRHIVGSGATLEAAFPNGMRVPSDISSELSSIRSRFWIATSLHTDPNNYVYYGNRAGQAMGIFRLSPDEGELRLKLKAEENRSKYRFQGIYGGLNFISREDKMFDPRQRPWYIAGQTATTDTWTSVYIDFGTLELVATRARRVMGLRGEIEGVVATDMSLRRLNDFVRSLKVSPRGIAFIIEPNGNLIASSVGDNVKTLSDGTNQRLTAAQSGNPLQAAVYTELRNRLIRQPVTTESHVFSFTDIRGESIHAAYAAIKDQAGLEWITVVAAPSSDFMGSITKNFTSTLVIGILAIAVAIAMGLIILNWVAGGLQRLSLAALRVGNGYLDVSAGTSRHDKIGDIDQFVKPSPIIEIAQLAQSFNSMSSQIRKAHQSLEQYAESLEHTVSERTHDLEVERNNLKMTNEILAGEIELARRIQEKMIPSESPLDTIHSLYKPMAMVGGDFYDFVFFENSEKIGVFISDVSGHGVPAAFITSMIKTILLQAGDRKNNPAELLHYMNEVLQNQTAGNFVTAFYGIYDPAERTIRYANAGHPLPYLITRTEISQLPKGKSTALALFSNDLLKEKNKDFINFEAVLPAASKILFYTDGFLEATPSGNILDSFELVKLPETFRELYPETSEAFISKLFERLVDYRGSDSFEDDICMVCFDII